MRSLSIINDTCHVEFLPLAGFQAHVKISPNTIALNTVGDDSLLVCDVFWAEKRKRRGV